MIARKLMNADNELTGDWAKYPKLAKCLNAEREALLTHFDFPAEHWKHLRTTNPLSRPSPRSSTVSAARRAPARGPSAGERIFLLSTSALYYTPRPHPGDPNG